MKNVTGQLSSHNQHYIDNPYEIFRRMHESGEKITQVEFEGVRVWIVIGYDDIRGAISDPAVSVNPQHACLAARAANWVFAEDSFTVTQNMLRFDAPEHTRLRRLVTAEFTAGRVNALRPRIQQIADGLVTELLPTGHAELMKQFAQRLPLAVMCDVLGVPDLDRAEFTRLAMMYIGTGPDDAARISDTAAAMRDYLVGLCGEKIARPAHGPDSRLLDRLALGADGNGDRLTLDELVAMSFLLLVAGFETTTGLIGNSMLAVLTRMGEVSELRDDTRWIGPLVDEVLRFDGPIKVSPVLRFTTDPVRFGDTVVPGGGEPILFAYSAANRDPDRFPDPDDFNPDRDNSGHLGFGHGAHRCLGATLGKAEVEISVSTLVRRLGDLRLAIPAEELLWGHSRFMRGLTALPVVFTPSGQK